MKLIGKHLSLSQQKKWCLPAVCVLIEYNNQVLAVSRKDDLSKFGFPGGKNDLNWYGKPIETPEQAIYREAEEETGLNLYSIKKIYEGSEEGEFWTICYTAEASGDICTKEAGVVKWVDWQVVMDGPFGNYNKKVKEIYEAIKK